MTRTFAKQLLADTWLFKQVDDTIALREVALIEAVRTHEMNLASIPPTREEYAAYRSPRAV